jgi:hypothetical protein
MPLEVSVASFASVAAVAQAQVTTAVLSQPVILNPYRAMIPYGTPVAEGDSVPQHLRQFEAIVADAVVEELHTDRSTITRHPVEQGITVSDNVVDEPAELTLTYGWSPGSNQNAVQPENSEGTLATLASSAAPGSDGNPHFLQRLYGLLIQLKQAKVLLAIYTGKRYYINMLIESITTTTDVHTENCLLVRITCRELIVVATTIYTLASDPNAVQDPQSQLGTIGLGVQQPTPAQFPDPGAAQQALNPGVVTMEQVHP